MVNHSETRYIVAQTADRHGDYVQLAVKPPKLLLWDWRLQRLVCRFMIRTSQNEPGSTSWIIFALAAIQGRFAQEALGAWKQGGVSRLC
jgi:hypothetical protein